MPDNISFPGMFVSIVAFKSESLISPMPTLAIRVRYALALPFAVFTTMRCCLFKPMSLANDSGTAVWVVPVSSKNTTS